MASHPTSLIELRDGDRMSRDEFLWRWEQLPDLKFAELIDGVVYLSSPLSDAHSIYEQLMNRWLSRYEDSATDAMIRPNATWLLGDSSLQPDLALLKENGASYNEGKFRAGPPELVGDRRIELAPRSRTEAGVVPPNRSSRVSRHPDPQKDRAVACPRGRPIQAARAGRGGFEIPGVSWTLAGYGRAVSARPEAAAGRCGRRSPDSAELSASTFAASSHPH